MEQQRCTKCSKIKHLLEFDKQRKSKNGHRSKCKVCRKEDEYLSQRDKILTRRKVYYSANKDKAKAYDNANRDRINARRKTRLKENINFKLSERLRVRLCNALRNNQKRGSAVNDLGCTVNELRLHIESKFLSGMSWDNYGNKRGQWSIDHIKPLSRFNLADREEFLIACHFTNLQPLWVEDNIRKSNKLE